MSASDVPSGDPSLPVSDSTATPVARLGAEVKALRTLFNIAMLALLLLLSSLFSFMLWELKLVRRQIEENSRFVAEYKRKVEPRLNELHSKLFAYSRLHPNFTPILVKYFGATNTPLNAGPASATPSPLPGTLGPQSEPPPR